MHRGHDGARSRLTRLLSLVRGAAPDLPLDVVELTDPLDRLGRQRRGMRLLEIIKLASHMGPAAGFLDLVVLVEVVKSGISIGLQHAAKPFQMPPRMFSLAVGLVSKPDCRGGGVAGRAVIPHVGPQPSGFGLALARR